MHSSGWFGALSLAMTSVLPMSAFGQSPGSCTNPLRLTQDATALRTAFNEARGKVRLLFVIDPICPGCLRGAAQMKEHVLKQHVDDSNVRTFVVHLSVLGGKETDTPRTCKALGGPGVTHYWDDGGDFGRTLARALSLTSKKTPEVFAWDVWLAYPATAEWTDSAPPLPAKFMHQLWALSNDDRYEFLDADSFARTVNQLVKDASPRH